MNAIGIRSDFVLAHRAVIRIAELVCISESKELLHIIRTEEKALVVEELESVPFERVMACGNDDARISLEMRRQKFHGRGRRKAHIHDIHAGKAADASDKLHNRIACGAAIAANHHALCLRDFEECTHVALQDLRSKGITNDSADTRNRTHQFRHIFSNKLNLAKLRDRCIKDEIFRTFINQAVGMTLRAEMALARFDVFNAVIEKHLALARDKEHNFAVGFVFVVTDRRTSFERAVHNARRAVEIHLGLVFFFATLKIRENSRLHAF